MYVPTIFEPFRPFRPLLSGASSESWAQDGCRPKSHCDSVISVMQQTTLAPRVIRDSIISVMQQTTLLRSQWKCLALWVMYRQRGENCRTRHQIHSRCSLLFLARVCVLRKYWSISQVTWRIFHCDKFPQIIQSAFLLYNTHTCYQVSPLVIPGNAGYPSWFPI